MEDSRFIIDILQSNRENFGYVLDNAEEMRFQILVSEVIHYSEGHTGPTLVRHGFRADHEYFYPASTIKICVAVLALQKLQFLRQELTGKDAAALSKAFAALLEKRKTAPEVPLDMNEATTLVVQDVRRLFLISDNEAFDRLFAFVGHQVANEAMWALGFSSVRLRHCLSSSRDPKDDPFIDPLQSSFKASTSQSDAPTPITFDWLGTPLSVEPPASPELPGMDIGKGYIDENGNQVNHPMDFRKKNAISLKDLHDFLIKLFRSDALPDTSSFQLDDSLRLVLQEAMVQYPADSQEPHYIKEEFPDDYCKFFLPGLCRVRPKKAIRVFNKCGLAYGFLNDTSYILDVETGREFFLAMNIYANANGILNDDTYEYDLAFKLATDLGEAVARAVWQIPPHQSLSATCLDRMVVPKWLTHLTVPVILGVSVAVNVALVLVILSRSTGQIRTV
eukprot:TRINITY_DN19357_c0_g1_i1.p1 TRINITY_DN19357_c0_g1~~TRINITY_DN19357_c0_g1_i1.p1  ORF type:complete len:449 (-),score=63.59 TRINITY_DN19357_c0_g1_i1:364-1710(-)